VAARGDAEAQAARLRVALDGVERAAADASGRAATAAAAAEDANAALARSAQRVRLLQDERDSLQRLLKSYDEVSDEVLGRGAPGADAARDAREAELQAALGRAHGRVAALEADALAAGEAADAARRERDAARAAAAEATGRAAAAEREADAASKEVALLTTRLGRGEFDVERVRVMHLRANPEAAARDAAAKAAAEAAASEIGELRAALQALRDAAGAPSADAQGGAVAAAELAVLQRRCSELEKRESRYKAVFRESITHFREACRLIFGFSIDMAGERFSLRSVYATRADETLVVRVARGADGDEALHATLEPNEYTQRADMRRCIDTFIGRCKSVPAFTANITIELFNQMTLQ
jgi:mitotic spindle assembly checkpoint protein MAD1